MQTSLPWMYSDIHNYNSHNHTIGEMIISKAQPDVIVIGAGLAGLTAARALTRRGISTLVLEARNRTGGRVHSVMMPDGSIADLGGQWIGPGQRRMQRLAKEAGLKCQNIKIKGRTVKEPLNPLSVIDRLQIAKLGLRLAKEARRTPRSSPWQHPLAETLDHTPINEWLEKIATPRAAQAWHNLISKSFCTDPQTISVLEGLHHLASIGGLLPLASAETSFFVDGAGSVAGYLAKDLDIRLNTPVKSIKRTADGVQVQSDSGVINTRQVVLAVPPQLACRLLAEDDQINTGLIKSPIQTSVVKTVLLYKKAWWTDNGFSGFGTTSSGPVNELFYCPSPDKQNGCLITLSTGNTAQALPTDKRARNKSIVEHIARLLNGHGHTPIAIESVDWNAEPFSLGGYAAVRPFGSWLQQRKLPENKSGPIHLAGTETATQWRSYMDGAVQSGERAAENIQHAISETKTATR